MDKPTAIVVSVVGIVVSVLCSVQWTLEYLDDANRREMLIRAEEISADRYEFIHGNGKNIEFILNKKTGEV